VGRVVTDLLRGGEVAAAGRLPLELSPPHGGARAMRAGGRTPELHARELCAEPAAEESETLPPFHASGLGISGNGGSAFQRRGGNRFGCDATDTDRASAPLWNRIRG
jgi:hypothetical protein